MTLSGTDMMSSVLTVPLQAREVQWSYSQRIVFLVMGVISLAYLLLLYFAIVKVLQKLIFWPVASVNIYIQSASD